MEENGLMILNEEYLMSKIYIIRGVQVMLDADLAEIYGYTTKAFNQQVKNNVGKFDDDFRFRITKEEYYEILRSKNLTSKFEQRGGRQYLPYVFSEQGIYMLMTVLKGELAVSQSKKLMWRFLKGWRQKGDLNLSGRGCHALSRHYQKSAEQSSISIVAIWLMEISGVFSLYHGMKFWRIRTPLQTPY